MERHLWNMLELINDVIIPELCYKIVLQRTLEVSQCTARVFARLSRAVRAAMDE